MSFIQHSDMVECTRCGWVCDAGDEDEHVCPADGPRPPDPYAVTVFVVCMVLILMLAWG